MAKSKRSETAGTPLSTRALNRALLARQMLLAHAPVSAIDAIHRLVGLQAQVPSDPYYGLWSRLKDFDPADVSALLTKRKAVRIATLRGTIHLMTAADALAVRPLVQPTLERLVASIAYGKATADVDRKKLIAAGSAAIEAKAMTLAELRKVLAPVWPKHDPVALGWLFHYITPLVQVPPRGLWGESGASRVTTLPHWLGKPMMKKPDVAALVLRYLAAFGPASVMDAQAWSRLTKLGAVFDALRPKLTTFTDETGRELFDLPDAPRPDEDTPAPPRFLPIYDNVTLGFANRDRIIRPGIGLPRPLPDNGQVRAFLVDGFVAGFWKLVEESATLIVEPFAPLSKRDLAALTAEGKRLVKFALPGAKGARVEVGKSY